MKTELDLDKQIKAKYRRRSFKAERPNKIEKHS